MQYSNLPTPGGPISIKAKFVGILSFNSSSSRPIGTCADAATLFGSCLSRIASQKHPVPA